MRYTVGAEKSGFSFLRLHFCCGIWEDEMTIEDVKAQIREQPMSTEEQIRRIRKIRCQLLEEIHCKQQLLDQVDYLIYELRKGGI